MNAKNVATIALVLSIAGIPAVDAGNIDCDKYADVAREFINARYQGIPSGKIRAIINDDLKASQQNKELVLDLLTRAYGETWATSDEFAYQIRNECEFENLKNRTNR
ncbi:MAG TPA: hypothetical protein VMB26_01215 [Candidatus Binataceae bacterium]|nr:hypothetical protein [Candidatus Binataceae bacterium]